VILPSAGHRMATMPAADHPVIVTVTPRDAAQFLHELLLDYQSELLDDGREPFISIVPADAARRGTVIYRVVQASLNVHERYPESSLFLITEDGNRWRLPPPPINDPPAVTK
jgi:hypothetical protein